MLLIAGSTGYVGGLLADELAERGEDVRCMARSPERAKGKFDDRCEIVRGDVLEPDTLGPAMEGVDVAYYLVHSMGRGGRRRLRRARPPRSEQLREGGQGRRRQADHLPGRPRRGHVQAPPLATGDGGGPRLDRRPADLLPRRDRDRIGKRVAAHDRLSRPAPAGDDHAELDDQQDPADRRRRRRRLSGRRAEGRGLDRPRGGGRREPRSPPTASCSTSRPRCAAIASARGSGCRSSRRA